ncbi:MAG: hypothetical protein ACLQEQ_03170 [Nitrososphaerales archaeon]
MMAIKIAGSLTNERLVVLSKHSSGSISNLAQMGMVDRPTGAFLLSFIGGIYTIFIGSLWGVYGATSFWGNIGIALGIAGFICGAMIIIGAILQYSDRQSRVRAGSFLVLAFAIASIPLFYLDLIGFALSLIGAILGLTWKARPLAPPST